MDSKGPSYAMEFALRDRTSRGHIVAALESVKDRYGVAGKRVLEIGCGLGNNLRVFESDNEILGVESEEAVVRDARRDGVKVVQGDVEVGLELTDQSQDVVLCLDVLEHLIRPAKAMEEIRRVLVDDGIVVINVPNHFDWKGRMKLLLGYSLDVHNFFPGTDDWDNPHIRFFTYSGIRRLACSCGFRVVEDLSGCFPSFISDVVLLRWLARLRPGLFAGGFFMVLKKDLVSA